MSRDSITETGIKELVDRFYEKVRTNAALAPAFEECLFDTWLTLFAATAHEPHDPALAELYINDKCAPARKRTARAQARLMPIIIATGSSETSPVTTKIKP